MQVSTETNEREIKTFNPFEILGVDREATESQIKKAFRKMSLVYHPDKNPDDPLASAKFIQITKAYNALTDEAARANFEKYGNPDGPQTTKVGIGLPRFLLEKKNHILILLFFFSILLIIVPTLFIIYYQRQKLYSASGSFFLSL